MKIVLVFANTPYFSDVEKAVLERSVAAIADYVGEKQIRCVACMTGDMGVFIPRPIETHRSSSSKSVVEPGDIVISQYSTFVFDIGRYGNKIVLLNNKATSFLLHFPWVINHELQVARVMDEVLADSSPLQEIWAIVNSEHVVAREIERAGRGGVRLAWVLKALLDRVR
jgi:hypothetical protein